MKWSFEEQMWLRENFSHYETHKELTDSLNTRFGNARTVESVQQKSRALGLKRAPSPIKWSDEEEAWLTENFGKVNSRKLHMMFVERFRDISYYAFRSHVYIAKGMRVGNAFRATGFENKRLPIGAERKRNGYTFMKVDDVVGTRGSHDAERHNWKFKHVIEWERHNGLLPKGYQVVFLNGNKEDFSKENLAAIPKKYMRMMNANGWLSGNELIAKIGIQICEIHYGGNT
jgi:hypothetical protein